MLENLCNGQASLLIIFRKKQSYQVGLTITYHLVIKYLSNMLIFGNPVLDRSVNVYNVGILIKQLRGTLIQLLVPYIIA